MLPLFSSDLCHRWSPFRITFFFYSFLPLPLFHSLIALSTSCPFIAHSPVPAKCPCQPSFSGNLQQKASSATDRLIGCRRYRFYPSSILFPRWPELCPNQMYGIPNAGSKWMSSFFILTSESAPPVKSAGNGISNIKRRPWKRPPWLNLKLTQQLQYLLWLLVGLSQHRLCCLGKDRLLHLFRHFFRHVHIPNPRFSRSQVFWRSCQVVDGVV